MGGEVDCMFLVRIAVMQGLSGRIIAEGKLEVNASREPMMSVSKG